MMSKSFFLCAEPDSKLKSDRLSPKQIYESRGSLFHPGAKRGKKRQAKRHSSLLLLCFLFSLLPQPPMTLRWWGKGGRGVEQSEKGGGGRAKREGGRGERSGQVVHCEPVSVSLFSKQARSSWPAFRPEGTQNKQLRLLRVQLAYQGPETLFGAKRTLPFLHRPKEMMLRLGGSHFALQEGNYHSLLSSSLFFPTFSGIGPLL